MGVNIARMLKYDITLPTGAIVDALGEFNRGNFARSLPETKGNMHLGWASGNQNANLNVNYITSYKNGADAVDSYTTVDAQYGITISTGRDDHNLMLSIGAKNLLNEEPPRVIDAANYSFDPKQHSAVGRAVYVKANYSF
jgi:iron complex outermembrane receptor protein